MKKFTLLFTLLIALISCNDNPKETHIEGEIKGLGNDTIYLYGADGSFERIDTLIAKDGKIDYTLEVDTVTSAMLLFNHQTQVPIFLDKKQKITIQGTADALEFLAIGGSTANEEYTAFQQTLKGMAKPSKKMLEKRAEEFIRQHPSSLINIYLLNKYFVQQTTPDYAQIKTLIEMMPGTLQDNPLIGPIKEYIDEIEKVAVGRTAPYFSLRNAKGEKVTRSEKFKDKYLLIHFWASWNDASMKANAKLRKINRSYKKEKNFGMLGISLDVDTVAWKEAIKKDTLSWEQVCNFEGLNSEIVNQYAILTLPTNVLIEPSGRIAEWNVKEEDLKRLIPKKDANQNIRSRRTRN